MSFANLPALAIKRETKSANSRFKNKNFQCAYQMLASKSLVVDETVLGVIFGDTLYETKLCSEEVKCQDFAPIIVLIRLQYDLRLWTISRQASEHDLTRQDGVATAAAASTKSLERRTSKRSWYSCPESRL